MSFDWAIAGTWAQAVAGFAQALVVVYAAKKAADTFNSWRRQRLEERRIDAAERTLSLVYRVKQAFVVIRSPAMSQSARDEAVYNLIQSGLELSDYDTDKQNKIIEAQVVLDRINRYSDLWNEFSSTLPVAAAFFGSKAEEPLQQLWIQKAKIQVAAEQYPNDDGSDPQFNDLLRLTIWENRQRVATTDDRVGQAIAQSIVDLESLMLPIIRDDRLPSY